MSDVGLGGGVLSKQNRFTFEECHVNTETRNNIERHCKLLLLQALSQCDRRPGVKYWIVTSLEIVCIINKVRCNQSEAN